MHRSSKIAISLPKEDFDKIEKLRKKLGFGRSAVIDKAIRFWLSHFEQEELVKQYEEGYRKKPESIQEIKAMEEATADAFEEEDLK